MCMYELIILKCRGRSKGHCLQPVERGTTSFQLNAVQHPVYKIAQVFLDEVYARKEQQPTLSLREIVNEMDKARKALGLPVTKYIDSWCRYVSRALRVMHD